MSACVTVIPARLGSTRFPRKVLARLAGRTMIEWCWRAAKAAKLGPVLVAVDSREVADEVRRFGGEAVMTSPSLPSGSDRVWAAAKNRREPIILNFQGDMPLIKPSTLRATVKALRRGTDIATSVIAIDDPSRRADRNVVKAVLTNSRRCLYFSRAPVSSWVTWGYTRTAARRSSASSRCLLRLSRRPRSSSSSGRSRTAC